ncbi:MAG: hypothetical protein M3004_07360, partial [Bacteroidota bacterium]|nr:hypothetical protein [Bacteroidota bacterium]
MKKFIFILSVFVSAFTINVHAQTGDPWIKQIYKTLYMREPNAVEYNIQNYNGGSWNNYNELQEYIKQYTNSLRKSGITFT